ncbi:hypothetical protein QI30_19630 [Kurthia sp. 3B1D]|uniref:Uncharacterized protein n=1 Tax=Candidatus Kurthia intestinigallinarum TaxID=1562256 RepID=A0A433RNM8_9BACL|nr:hypothetical protein QI30_19630 [Kurthia sp. 3B1D]
MILFLGKIFIEKKLGKELNYYDPNNSVDANRTSFYKAGKYYVGVYKFASISDIYTIITVGTKAKTSAHYDIVFY